MDRCRTFGDHVDDQLYVDFNRPYYNGSLQLMTIFNVVNQYWWKRAIKYEYQ